LSFSRDTDGTVTTYCRSSSRTAVTIILQKVRKNLIAPEDYLRGLVFEVADGVVFVYLGPSSPIDLLTIIEKGQYSGPTRLSS